MKITVDKNTIDLNMLLMTVLYNSGTKMIEESDSMYTFEYTQSSVPELIEDHAETFPNFSMEDHMLKYSNMQKEITIKIQNLLDTKARSKGYDGMQSVRSYAGYDNEFKDECVNMARWCSLCWAKAKEIAVDVNSGARPFPTVAQAMSEMPELQDMS